MKSQLEALFTQTLQDLSLPTLSVQINRPENPAHGEYTTNIAFLLGKSQKKNPVEIATKIIEYLQKQKDQAQNAEVFSILQAIESISIAGPGFINVHIVSTEFSNLLKRVIEDKELYGTRKKIKETEKKNSMIEYTDPNPFKELHIGHLYSNAVGESLSRLYESQGWNVKRACYQGDVGLHVAKALWGMISNIGLQSSNLSEYMKILQKKPLEERAKWLGEAYVVGANAYEEDDQAQKEIKQINIMAFIAAQQMHKEEFGVEPIIDYSNLLTVDSNSLWQRIPKLNSEDVAQLYTIGRSWSLEYFETQYKKLGTHFDSYYFESMVAEMGYQIVKDHIADGIFEQSDGAVVYRGEKKGLHTRVFINALGLPTYEAKELGLAPKKFADWQYDRSIIVTGKEIDEYFKVLLSALGEIRPELASKTTHISHGMVRLPEGKMSSRKGNVLTAEWLISEVTKSISILMDKNASSYDSKEQNDIVEKAAIAAIKYSLLKVSLPSDIAFDFNRSVSFDGDSGPYLLYTYARCKSVLRKSSDLEIKTQEHDYVVNPDEKMIARQILYFPEIVAEAAENLSPSTIVRYLIELAQAFNLFYAKHQILDSKLDVQHAVHFRLSLTEATAQVLKNGLYLLGIQTVERM